MFKYWSIKCAENKQTLSVLFSYVSELKNSYITIYGMNDIPPLMYIFSLPFM